MLLVTLKRQWKDNPKPNKPTGGIRPQVEGTGVEAVTGDGS